MNRMLLLSVLLLVPVKGARAQQVEQGGGLFQSHEVDQMKVNLAITKGVAYLKKNNASHMTMFKLHGEREGSRCELVLYTYVHGGVEEKDDDFQALFKNMMDRGLEATYCVALQAMILEEIERVKHQKRIAQCAQFLVDNQATTGSWSYGDPSIFVEEIDVPTGTPQRRDVASGTGPIKSREFDAGAAGVKTKPVVKNKVKVSKKRDGTNGDNSNTQYAALGLRACHDSGIVLEAKVVDLAMKWWRECQKDEKGAPEELIEGGVNGPEKSYKGGTVAQSLIKLLAVPNGWCYVDHKEHPAYGSMTVGAVGALAIYNYIGDNDGGKKRSWKKDKDIHEGLVWLAKNYSVTYNPGTHEHGGGVNGQKQYYYYLYGLERAGLLYGTEMLGSHKWYPEGAKVLIEAQKSDGSWDDALNTCFAILFLKRATKSLDVATHSVSGNR
jgi:hypothetical protein